MVTLDMAAGGLEEAGGGDALAKEKRQKRRKAKGVGGSGEHGNPAADDSLEAAKNNDEKEEPSECSPSGEYTTTEKKKKKKKKQRLEEMGSADVPQHPLAQEEPSGKKLKKTKDTSAQSEAAGHLKTDEEGVPATREIKRPKKVKVVNQSQAIRLDERAEDDEDVVTKTTKKSKTGSKTGVTETLARGEEPQGVHQKAKKRKARSETADDAAQTVKKNKKGKQEETTASVVVVDEKSPKPKKKKNKKKMKSETEARESADSPEAEGAQGVSVVGAKEQQRKKKKRPKSDEQTAAGGGTQSTETFVFVASTGDGRTDTKGASGDTNIQEEEEVSVDRKKKKKKRDKKVKLEEEPGMAPTPEETPHRDAVLLSEEAGNGDKLTINQDRRLALQMDIDKESSPKTPAKPSGFGQWGTAQFDSSDKQHKFLRLMGGFKKEAQASGPSPARPNMALARDRQQDLHQALLGEFERAQSRRVDLSGRGAGLGFSAPPSKKFFIDANASRSVRFDD